MSAETNNDGNDEQDMPKPKPKRHLLLKFCGLLLLAALAWFGWVYRQINLVANRDDAQTADAIAVFGAAEYSGRPSPVLHARLDKAVSLYQKQIAPVIVTLGGGGDRDSGKSEAGVGRNYLLAKGVAYDKIIIETESTDTEQQVDWLAAIARREHFAHIVVVSDGTHLFRIQKLCERAGLSVYTSPRARLGNIDDYDAAKRRLHEMLSYTALAMNLHIDWLRRWLDGKND